METRLVWKEMHRERVGFLRLKKSGVGGRSFRKGSVNLSKVRGHGEHLKDF